MSYDNIMKQSKLRKGIIPQYLQIPVSGSVLVRFGQVEEFVNRPVPGEEPLSVASAPFPRRNLAFRLLYRAFSLESSAPTPRTVKISATAKTRRAMPWIL